MNEIKENFAKLYNVNIFIYILSIYIGFLIGQYISKECLNDFCVLNF